MISFVLSFKPIILGKILKLYYDSDDKKEFLKELLEVLIFTNSHW